MSFEPAVHLDDLPDVGAVQVTIDGQAVSVVRAEDGSIHAIDDTCSHAEVSLSEGVVDDCTVECWMHGSSFVLRTGRPTALPATQPIDVYPVRIEDDVVHVDITAPINSPTNAGSDAAATTSKEH
jgi:3-phenylpropionate/trans-cinnamate dioxygenase ferredoxin subunit